MNEAQGMPSALQTNFQPKPKRLASGNPLAHLQEHQWQKKFFYDFHLEAIVVGVVKVDAAVAASDTVMEP